MALVLAVISLCTQVLSFVGIGFLLADLMVLPGVFFPDGDWSFAGLSPYAIETIVGYWPVFLLAAVGAMLSALLMVTAGYRGAWFLGICRVLGWLWLPLLPIGPVLGAILLRARIFALRGSNA